MVNAVLGGGQFVNLTCSTIENLKVLQHGLFVNLYSILSFGVGPGASVVVRLLCDRGQKIFCASTNKTAEL